MAFIQDENAISTGSFTFEVAAAWQAITAKQLFTPFFKRGCSPAIRQSAVKVFYLLSNDNCSTSELHSLLFIFGAAFAHCFIRADRRGADRNPAQPIGSAYTLHGVVQR
ncbi:hypothetical protein NPS53_09230 [Pseudomonas putida]|uniref:hypothetical protein n=1 Tax=Pseudomonas putida TaxID=303 RepID=UPI0023639BF4|nr:hypothetical protein [Pseudomonas putida]MDD2139758.1 hypothetical protein [Pseudomonas putida]HDS1721682.1 hypothetical protein [Pseudomonas putida]